MSEPGVQPSSQSAGDETEETAEAQPQLGGLSDKEIRRRALRAVVLSVLGLSILWAAINWPYRYEVANTTEARFATVVDFQRAGDPPTIAGWPYHYWVSYPENERQADSSSVFSWRALALNFGVATIPCVIVSIFFYRRTRKVAAGQLACRRVTIADLLAVTLALAVPFALWQRVTMVHKAEITLAKEITSFDGAVISEAWVPRLLARLLPDSLVEKLTRIRAVRCESPTDMIVQKIVDHPGLTVIRLGGSDYDLRLLDRMVSNPFLTDLRVAGRLLDSTAMQSIASHRNLHTLNLMRTNVSQEAVPLLDRLPRLKRLNLMHTDVVLSKLDSTAWTKNIEELWLPHPDADQEDQLEINGWQNLTKLRIDELDTPLNPAPLRVELANLPKLKTLQLDLLQKFDLTLRGLPEFSVIECMDHQWESRIPRNGAIPKALWVSRLILSDLPSLSGGLNLSLVDVQEFKCSGTPNLQALGVTAQCRRRNGAPYAPELKLEAASALIQGLGQSEGPQRVNLAAVPMKGVDLSPLRQNRQLKELMLSYSQTTAEQWKGLQGMDWLTRLELKGCRIDPDAVQWVLDSFPELEHLSFSTSRFDSSEEPELAIIDRTNLKTLDLGERPLSLKRMRIVNAPHLAMEIDLQSVQQLELVDAPRLTGLSVGRPYPSDSTLKDLQGLRYFAVGGAGVTDETLQGIAACNGLSTLTLAYPSVTANGLKQLTTIGSLDSLNLPGTPLDDSVVASWPEFERLENLDVRDTNITGVSLRKLLKAGKAKRVLLDRTNVAGKDLALLAKLPRLDHLSLQGLQIDAESMKAVLAGSKLTSLDLSNTSLSEQVLDAVLASGSKLIILVLQNSEVDGKKLLEIAQQHPKISFDLSGSSVPAEIQARLLSADKIVSMEEMREYSRMMMQQSGASNSLNYVPAIIDVEQFMPKPETDAFAPSAQASPDQQPNE